MCGIYGVIGGTIPYQKRMLATRNESRGTDGVGFIYTGRDEKLHRTRSEKSITDAIVDGRIPKDVWDAHVFLGHTRGASTGWGIGGVKKENAHPFINGKITGAHNGCVQGWKDIVRKHEKEHAVLKTFTVDSQVIFWGLDHFGVDFFKEIEGYGAVWWLDSDNPTEIRFWIYKQDFSIGFGEDGSAAFSSSGEDLRVCGFKKVEKLNDNGQLVKLDLEKREFVSFADPIEPKERTLVGNFHGMGWEGAYGHCGYGSTSSSTTPTRTIQSTNKYEMSELMKITMSMNTLLYAKRDMRWCMHCMDVIMQPNCKEIVLEDGKVLCPVCNKESGDMDEDQFKLMQLRLELLGYEHPEQSDFEFMTNLEEEEEEELPIVKEDEDGTMRILPLEIDKEERVGP